MFDPNRQRANNQSFFLKSVQGFATCVAVIVTVLVTPAIHDLTGGFVGQLVTEAYGANTGKYAQFIYLVLLFPTVFFAVRASLATAIVGAATWAAIRFI
jgi:hypothetical protein